MKITWYGHSCFKVESKDGSAVFDPYAPGKVPGLELPEITADAVFCSHGHGDHNYSEGVKLTGNKPGFSVTQINCFHDGNKGAQRGENLITAVDAEGMRVVHLGDLGHPLSMEQIKELGTVDILFIPVGGYYTIDAQDAAMIVSVLSPRVTIPMHYRGEGFGYDVIDTVDAFVRLAGKVQQFDTNEIEITPDTSAMTALLRCPTK